MNRRAKKVNNVIEFPNTPSDARENTKLEVALENAADGFQVIRLAPDAKDPPIDRDFSSLATSDHERILNLWLCPVTGWLQDYNVGISTDFLCAVDVDLRDGKNGFASLEAAGIKLPKTRVHGTPSGGRHVIYRSDRPVSNRQCRDDLPGIDIRGWHGYVLAPGATIEGGEYTVIDPSPIADLPPELFDQLGLRWADTKKVTDWSKLEDTGKDDPSDIARAIELLRTAKPSTDAKARNNTLYDLMCQVRDLGISLKTARDLAYEHFRERSDLEEWEFDKTIKSAYTYAQNEPGSKSLDADFGDIPAEEGMGDDDTATDDITTKKLPVSHDSLALRFSERHADDLRYVSVWGQWLLWDGTRWRVEQTLRAFDLARALAREEAAKHKRAGKEIRSAATVAAIVGMARSDRRHASSADVWDTDPWLLCTPDGTVDLRTGQLRENRRSDLITKSTAVGPRGDCPLWLKFLDQTFRGDQELIAFKQRVLGYSLTGSTREHALFFDYGLGGNGKGVLLNTWLGIMGDYATVAPMKTFTESRYDRHLTELAMLRGARAVIAQEVEAGARWAEVRVKALTGGDPITANFMRQDHFTFAPQFKLLMAGNHKPALRDVSEAMRRRLHMIPFDVTVAKEHRDPRLPEKLRSEWPGILRWAIEGCLEWQQIGLAPPAAVREATERYFLEQDAVTRFLGESCMTDDPNATEETGELYSAWQRWCHGEDVARMSFKAFSQKLDELNFKRSNHPKTRLSQFQGIRVIRADFWA